MKIRKRKSYEKKLEKQLMSAQSREFLMGSLRREWNDIEKSKRRKKLLDMTTAGLKATGKTLLVLAALGGVVTVAMIAPNIVSVFERSKKHRRYLDSKTLGQSINYLKKQGYIEQTSRKGARLANEQPEKEIKLTELGAKRMFINTLEELRLPKQDKWDRKWRLVMFDIPNRHKHARDGFRMRLKSIGFYQLQESVFVFPYPCKKEVGFCTYIYNVPEYVRFVETESLFEDRDLKDYFFNS